MSGMATKFDAINLGQGFPEFDCDPVLKDFVSKAMKDGHNQYAPMPGHIALRESLAQGFLDRYTLKVNPDTEITITAGATQALFTAFTAFISPGDEVILFDPAYDSYAPGVRLQGGVPLHIPLTNEFNIDFERLRAVIGPKTRMIVINSPHNPSGKVLSNEDVNTLAEILEPTETILLSDEVYEHLTLENIGHSPVLANPRLRERSIAVYSFGKTFHITGWKVGYAVASESLMSEFRKAHQFLVFSVSSVMQKAFAEYIQQEGQHLFSNLAPLFKKKRDRFLSGLEGSAWKWKASEGTYFQVLDYSEIKDENEFDFASYLTKEIGVASIPMSAFYKEQDQRNQLRFCFAKLDETLDRATELLCKI